jgi:hypothetical protein
LAFFASRFSFRDLLAAVFELFEPPLSLLAMVTSSRRRDRVLTVSLWIPSTDLLDPEGRTPTEMQSRGQMEAGRANERQEALAYGERHADHRAGRRGDGAAHDLDPALEKRGGRSFGAAPSEVHRANTLTSSTGHTMSCRPIGGSQGSGRWRQLFGARMP